MTKEKSGSETSMGMVEVITVWHPRTATSAAGETDELVSDRRSFLVALLD